VGREQLGRGASAVCVHAAHPAAAARCCASPPASRRPGRWAAPKPPPLPPTAQRSAKEKLKGSDFGAGRHPRSMRGLIERGPAPTPAAQPLHVQARGGRQPWLTAAFDFTPSPRLAMSVEYTCRSQTWVHRLSRQAD
jgi:hypothetical protein